MRFENSVLKEVVRPKRDEVTGAGENYTVIGAVICILNRIMLLGWLNAG
jgi:hypothetical protein